MKDLTQGTTIQEYWDKTNPGKTIEAVYFRAVKTLVLLTDKKHFEVIEGAWSELQYLTKNITTRIR